MVFHRGLFVNIFSFTSLKQITLDTLHLNQIVKKGE